MTESTTPPTELPKMSAVQIGGRLYVEEPDVRKMVNAILGTNVKRNERIAELEAEIERQKVCISEGSSFSLEQRTAETLDAERYRYLRSAAGQWGGDECGPMVCSGCGDNFEFLRGEEVDAEVDEAMAEWKAAGSPLHGAPK